MFACLSVLVITATSCSKSDSEKEEKGGDIVGSWMKVIGVRVSNDVIKDGEIDFLTFKKDGTYEYFEREFDINGTNPDYICDVSGGLLKNSYSVSGNTLQLKGFDDDDNVVSYSQTFSIINGKLVFPLPNIGLDAYPIFYGTYDKVSANDYSEFMKDWKSYVKKHLK